VRSVCRRWARESKAPETAWIVRRALRTLTSTAGTSRGPSRSPR
jgi:hypothetical protein